MGISRQQWLTKAKLRQLKNLQTLTEEIIFTGIINDHMFNRYRKPANIDEVSPVIEYRLGKKMTLALFLSPNPASWTRSRSRERWLTRPEMCDTYKSDRYTDLLACVVEVHSRNRLRPQYASNGCHSIRLTFPQVCRSWSSGWLLCTGLFSMSWRLT